jgi:hypothetical protein
VLLIPGNDPVWNLLIFLSDLYSCYFVLFRGSFAFLPALREITSRKEANHANKAKTRIKIGEQQISDIVFWWFRVRGSFD